MAVLVLDGHSRAALETLQSLGRAGVQVDIAAEEPNCIAFHSRYAARKLNQPSQKNVKEFHDWLRAQDQECNYELIVPATEASLLGFRQLDEDDPLRRKAVLPGNRALEIALDKEKTRALAVQLGIPAPQSILLSSLANIGQADQFPAVLKPARSKVMIDGELRTLAVAVVKNETHRQEQLRRWLPLTAVQQQQYVFGRGIGAEFLFNHGRKVWHFVHERVHEYPLTGGASSYRRSIVPPPGLLCDAEKLLTALQWHGVAMVEFKMDADGGYWLMEINPRFWGSLALSIDAGVDFPLGLLQVSRGETPTTQPEYKIHQYTRDLRTDVDWLKTNLRANHRDPLLHTRSRLFTLFELLRPLTGRESWDHFDWHDLGIARLTLQHAITDQLKPIYRKLRNQQIRRQMLRQHHAVLRRLKSTGLPSKIIFLCYGNICRSPLAAKLAEQQMPGMVIESAGFHDHVGRETPEKILRFAEAYGLDLSGHRSRRVTGEQLATADLVVVMDLENFELVKKQFPAVLPRTTLLGLFGSPATVAIADPYMADEATTARICEQVRDGVEALAKTFANAESMSQVSEVTSAVPSAR
jgi:protein-tyrosine-phosphatase/predicted ATP-grasp superfamily ATP-dependent carboligase